MTAHATTGLRPVAVFAAVAVVLLIGAASMALVGTPPNATANPTAMPTATAATAPTSPGSTPVGVPPLVTGPLAAGRYRTEFPSSPVTVDLTVGDGWHAGDSFGVKGSSTPWFVRYLWNPPVYSHSMSFHTVGNVNTDACDWEGTQPDPPVGPTVDDFVTALDAQQNSHMSRPVDVVLGGYAGKRVDLLVGEPYTCSPSEQPLVGWVRPDGQPGVPFGDPSQIPVTLWILDIEGQRVLIVSFHDGSAGAEAEVMGVLDSMEFTVN